MSDLYTLFFRPQLKYMEYQRAGSEVYYYYLGEKKIKKNSSNNNYSRLKDRRKFNVWKKKRKHTFYPWHI